MLDSRLHSLNVAVKALDNPDSLSILNIDDDLPTSPDTTLEYLARCQAWLQLRNIAKSIPDLLNQSQSVALVGFLGHFSSGKSSLINALLDISSSENPGYKRAVGLHPTDTGITIITHRDHAHIVKKSAYSVVDSVDVVHGPSLPFLEHAALVDTPGLGNEVAEQEAVTRFLHLCHVLVITIDGRRPFADKDKDFELLDIAFNRLSGVPKILVVTSAEEFLTSRMGSFSSDWQPELAEAFWDEAIARLTRDPRFQTHIGRLHQAPRFFVDSKEGFQVAQVKEILLPIITDEAHKSRIRFAQSHYVLSTATDALNVLLDYISNRSENLNRLLSESQHRADSTTTAVEEILESLESSFSFAKQRLQEARQSAPNVDFATETIVTQHMINEIQKGTLSKLEEEIKESLGHQLNDIREQVWHNFRKYYNAKTRTWLPTKREFLLDVLSEWQIDINSFRRRLSNISARCGSNILHAVDHQLSTTLSNAFEYLGRSSEVLEIGSSVRDIESSLERFERTHDDSVRSFYTYISAPGSIDLLREHGFVGFDDSGELAMTPSSVNALRSRGFTAIMRSADGCRKRLRTLYSQSPEDFENTSENSEERRIGEAEFGSRCFEKISTHINNQCQQNVSYLIEELSREMDRCVGRMESERLHLKRKRTQIWEARRMFLGRLGLVGFLILGVIIMQRIFAPEYFSTLLSALPEGMLQEVSVGVGSTVIVMILSYFIGGAKNRKLRQALQLATVARWRVFVRRRDIAVQLKEHFDELYEQLIRNVRNGPLEIDEVITSEVNHLTEEDSGSYIEARNALAIARELIRSRLTLVEEYVETVNRHLDEIPRELKDTSDQIKKDVVEAHMARIHEAAGTVSRVRAEVQRVADIARETV